MLFSEPTHYTTGFLSETHATNVTETLKALRSAAEDGLLKVFLFWRTSLGSKNGYRHHTSAKMWIAKLTQTSLQAVLGSFTANNLHSILAKYHFWPKRPIWWSPKENDKNHMFVKFNCSWFRRRCLQHFEKVFFKSAKWERVAVAEDV